MATYSFLGHSISTSSILGSCPKCLGHLAAGLGMVISMIWIVWGMFWIVTGLTDKKWWLEYMWLIFWDLTERIAIGLCMFMIWFVSMKGPGGNERSSLLTERI